MGMVRHRNPDYRTPIQFRIEADRCALRIGTPVTPDTVVGTDYETGTTLTAGCHGIVVAVGFSGRDHSLVVQVQPICS